jgi:hypothetical protein
MTFMNDMIAETAADSFADAPASIGSNLPKINYTPSPLSMERAFKKIAMGWLNRHGYSTPHARELVDMAISIGVDAMSAPANGNHPLARASRVGSHHPMSRRDLLDVASLFGKAVEHARFEAPDHEIAVCETTFT